MPNLAVQVFACLLLALNLPTVLEFWRAAPLLLRLLVAATIALPILQIIPLPPAARIALPGREVVAQGLALVDATDTWGGVSIEPHRTLLATLGLIAPFTTFVLTRGSRGEGTAEQMSLIVGLGVVSMILGAIQLASANTALMIQGEGTETLDLQGTFANRNTSGLFFDISLACLVTLPATGRVWLDHRGTRIAIGGLMLIGVAVSHSRSAIALSLLPLAFAAYGAWRRVHSKEHRRGFAAGVAALGIAGTIVVGLATNGDNRIADAAARFAQADDARAYIWPDAMVTVTRFWPVGGGMGTFGDAFELDESLETLQPLHAGRAHNEYIEIAYEAGILGLLLICGWVAWVIGRAFRNRRISVAPGHAAAVLGLALLALQSITDYPLRNQSLLCIAAWLIGLLAMDGGQSGDRSAIQFDREWPHGRH